MCSCLHLWHQWIPINCSILGIYYYRNRERNSTSLPLTIVWVGLASVLSVRVCGSVLSIRVAIGWNLLIEVVLGSTLRERKHVVLVFIEPLQQKRRDYKKLFEQNTRLFSLGLLQSCTHRVPPRRNQVLSAVAWSHLQVGPALPVAYGSWDSRGLIICRAVCWLLDRGGIAVAVGWWGLGKGMALIGFPNVFLINFGTFLLGSEEKINIQNCNFVCPTLLNL